MTEPITLPLELQQLLSEHREVLNARFRQRQKQGAKIAPEAWLTHLRQRVLPLVLTVKVVLPERCNLVLNELYDVSLELFSTGHFAETTGVLHQGLAHLWEHTLLRFPMLLARDPRRIVGSLSNALLFIAQNTPAAVEPWLARMEAAGPSASSVDQLLQIGKVAAWLAGLPEYRASAMALARKLPAAILRPLLELNETTDDGHLVALFDKWEADPWAELNVNHEARSTIRQVAMCGAFRGFGGLFLVPPHVFCSDGQLFATDDECVWLLQADRFGQSFHRSEVRPPSAKKNRERTAAQIDPKGKITWQQDSLDLPEFVKSSSQAFDGTTMAVTLPSSFHLYLFARPTSLEAGK